MLDDLTFDRYELPGKIEVDHDYMARIHGYEPYVGLVDVETPLLDDGVEGLHKVARALHGILEDYDIIL